MAADMINSPRHYAHSNFECIAVIEDWSLGFSSGNCIKYLMRANYKGHEREDLLKAEWYLRRMALFPRYVRVGQEARFIPEPKLPVAQVALDWFPIDVMARGVFYSVAGAIFSNRDSALADNLAQAEKKLASLISRSVCES